MEPYDIECISCGRDFEFSVQEQRVYNEKNFDEPKRCPECRKHKMKAKTSVRNKHGRRRDTDWLEMMG